MTPRCTQSRRPRRRARPHRTACVLLVAVLTGACATAGSTEDRASDAVVESTDAGTDPGGGALPSPASDSGSTAPAADEPDGESVGVADDVTIEVRDP